jgi:hypothetical protein
MCLQKWMAPIKAISPIGSLFFCPRNHFNRTNIFQERQRLIRNEYVIESRYMPHLCGIAFQLSCSAMLPECPHSTSPHHRHHHHNIATSSSCYFLFIITAFSVYCFICGYAKVQIGVGDNNCILDQTFFNKRNCRLYANVLKLM